jgi:hypothetical protein
MELLAHVKMATPFTKVPISRHGEQQQQKNKELERGTTADFELSSHLVKLIT